jgi:hypothetical protein
MCNNVSYPSKSGIYYSGCDKIGHFLIVVRQFFKITAMDESSVFDCIVLHQWVVVTPHVTKTLIKLINK